MLDRLSLGQRRGGGGRRDPCNPCRGTITMLIIGVVLNIVGLGFVCWALFALAIHALPFFVGVTGGFTHFRPGQVRSVSSSLASLRPVSHLSSGGTLSPCPLACCPPCHRAAIGASCGTRRLRCNIRPCSCWGPLGLVAGSVRRFRRHHRRVHRLGAHVILTEPAAPGGVLPRAQPSHR